MTDLDKLSALLATATSDDATTDDVTALHVAAVNALPSLIADNRRLRDWQERAIPELVRLVSMVEGWHERAHVVPLEGIEGHGQSGHPARGLVYEVDGNPLGKHR